jgi:hypothetical protein
MYSTDEFAALEIMCRDRATLAKTEMEFAEGNTGWQKQRNGSNSRTHMLGALSSITHLDSPWPSNVIAQIRAVFLRAGR